MKKLRTVSGEGDNLTFHGYGGPWMKKEGLQTTVDFDIGHFMDKTFTTYRKTKTFNETIYFRWNPFNLVTKHFTRNTDQVFEVVSYKYNLALDDASRTAKEDLPVKTQSYPQRRQ